MDDRSERTVGHRRHVLKENLPEVGVGAGMTDTYSAMYVYSNIKMAKTANAAWPANLTPSDFWYTGSLWSVNWGSEIESDALSVTLKKSTGEKQQFSTNAGNVWSARETVIFPANTTKEDGESYTVFVKNETKKQILVYHVGFFTHGDPATENYINNNFANEENANTEKQQSISTCVVTLSQTFYIYDGAEKKPSVRSVVTANRRTLREGTDYTVAYRNNVNAGTATVVITGIGNYTETVSKTFQIDKASPTFTIKNADFRKSAVNKKAKTTKITVTPNKGAKITYKNTSPAKLKKYIKVNKNGKVTLQKKAPVGTYKIKVTVAKGTNYKKTVQTIKISVRK